MDDAQETFRKLRKKTGLSQAKFAGKLSIPVHTYEQWEMGLRKPPAYVTEMITRILEYESLLSGCPDGTKRTEGMP